VVRVHPKFLDNQRLPPGKRDQSFWEERYRSINDLERHLTLNGTVIIKLFLNVSREEQRKRLLERIATPEKVWKFNPNDVKERELWDDFIRAYRDMLQATSNKWAPWYVLPADQKWLTRVLAANIIGSEIRRLGLEYPKLPEEYVEAVELAKAHLLKE
jgi:polyphosphate kinase 2 (PPK2 family)